MKSVGLLLLVGLLAFWAELTPTYGQPAICRLPKVVGNCLAYFPRYYFNPALNRCVRFIYGGCGGNANNFGTYKECLHTCKGKPGTCPTPPPNTSTTCDVRCENDWVCPGKQKCCHYGCMIACMSPI